jgi:hypothetical protein
MDSNITSHKVLEKPITDYSLGVAVKTAAYWYCSNMAIFWGVRILLFTV